MVATLLSLSLLATPQDLDKTITFESVARDARKMVAEISKASGVPLHTDQVMEREVLIVKVKDVKVKDLLDRVADVCGAKWEKKEDGLWLTRPVSMANEQKKAELTLRAKDIREAIAKLQKANGPADMTEAGAAELVRQNQEMYEGGGGYLPAEAAIKREGVRSAMPAGRLIVELAAKLPPEALAAITSDDFTWYANQPTPVQRPFPAGAQATLDRFARNQQLWNEAQAASHKKQFGDAYEAVRPDATPRPLGKVMFRVYDWAAAGYLMGSVIIADAERGLIAAHSQVLLRPTAYRSLLAHTPRAKPVDVSLSPVTRVVVSAMRSSIGANAPKPELSAEERDALLHPEDSDPLSHLVSDVVLGAAGALDRDLVGNVPDVFYNSCLSALSAGKISGEAAAHLLGNGGEVLALEDKRWLVIKPRYPVRARILRVSRREFGKMLRTAHARGYMAIDDLIPLASTVPGERLPRVCSTPMMVFDEFDGGFGGELDLVRFWGSLSTQARRVLGAGGAMNFSDLTPPQRKLLQTYVFKRIQLAALLPEERTRTTIDLYATEFLPSGITGSGQFTVADQLAEVAYGYMENGTGLLLPVDLLANDLIAQSQPETEGGAWGPFKTLKMATHRTLRFDFRFTPDVFLLGELDECRIPATEQARPFDQLPQAFRERVLKKVAEIKKQRSGSEGGGGG